jgi:hypothetical protein
MSQKDGYFQLIGDIQIINDKKNLDNRHLISFASFLNIT